MNKYQELKRISSQASSDVAKEILQQLGGNRFIGMTEAKNFVAGANELKFNIGRNNSGVNTIIIKLNSKDLYDIDFYRFRKLELKKLYVKKDVSVEQLRTVFEQVTKLRTSL